MVTEENADRFFTDAEEMIGWIDQPSLVPFMQYVPEELKEAFRNQVIDATLKRAIAGWQTPLISEIKSQRSQIKGASDKTVVGYKSVFELCFLFQHIQIPNIARSL